MEKNKKLITFILPSKNSGGTHVVIQLFNGINRIDENYSLHRVGKSVFGLFGELIKLFFYFVTSHFYKGNKVFVITEPLQCVIAVFSGVTYVRYVQAEDLSLFKKRAFFFGKVITLIQRLSTLKDRKFLYVSDYVKIKYLNQKIGGNNNCLSLKVNPLVDPGFVLISRAESGRFINNIKTYTVGYMARKSPSKGLDEFCFWMNSLGPNLSGKISKIIIISNEISYSTLKSKLKINFELICPSNYADIIETLKSVDVFVFNSKSEGFGLPPLEALLCGAQVVCSKCGGVDEYLDKSNSFLFNISDEVSFIDALSQPILHGICLDVDKSSLINRYSEYYNDFLTDVMNFIEK